MALYTRMGDDGTTGRPGGRRVSKADLAVAAGGDVDELTAHVGLCIESADGAGGELADMLKAVRRELFDVGALLAAAGSDRAPHVLLDDSAVGRIERQIDHAEAALPRLTGFILPGGTELACRLHVARTVCRRVERSIVAAADGGLVVPRVVRAYLNRLGDLLFAMARTANRLAGREDEPWRP
jgi:cob(I)alamin adenosyltransferase